MRYQGKEIEVLTRKTIFGKEIAEIKILSTSRILNRILREFRIKFY